MSARAIYETNDTVEIRRVLAIALRMWWLLILATVAAAALGYFVSIRQTPTYSATATLLVGETMQSTELDTRDIATSQQLALTYAGIAQLQPVLSDVVQRLDLDMDWQELRDGVTALPVKDTQFLELTVEANSPENAKLIANELANTVIRYSPTSRNGDDLDESRAFSRRRLERLQLNIAQGQERVDKLEALALASGAGSLENTREIQREIDTVQGLILGWENNYARLLEFTKGSSKPNYLTVVEPAQAGTAPVRPRIQLNTLIAGALGFCLTLGLVVLLGVQKPSAPQVVPALEPHSTT